MTVRATLFCCLLTAAYASLFKLTASLDGRIVGGEDVAKGDFPHLVSLRIGRNGGHNCGGAIIDEHWILTAAHCASGDIYAAAGKYDRAIVEDTEQIVRVAKAFKHENYRRVGGYDIAMLKLEKPLELNDYVQPIKLPGTDSQVDGEVVLAGWGLLKPHGPAPARILQKARLHIIDLAACKKSFAEKYGPLPLDTFHICTGNLFGTSGAAGDSGSPLIKYEGDGRPEVVGVTIWAVPPYGASMAPTGYMRVASFVDWIGNIMAKN